ncbi:MAG: hypothetical protein ACO3BU_08605 [Ilumatobacteraceae bacterium]
MSVADFATVVAPMVRQAVPAVVGTAVSGGETLMGSPLVRNEAPMVAV